MVAPAIPRHTIRYENSSRVTCSRRNAAACHGTSLPLRGARTRLLDALACLGSNNPSVLSNGSLSCTSFGSALNSINRVRLSPGLLDTLTALLGFSLGLANLSHPASTGKGRLAQRECFLSRTRTSGGLRLSTSAFCLSLGDGRSVFTNPTTGFCLRAARSGLAALSSVPTVVHRQHEEDGVQQINQKLHMEE